MINDKMWTNTKKEKFQEPTTKHILNEILSLKSPNIQEKIASHNRF